MIHTPKQEHYLSKLLGFLYTIKYRPSENNRAANALSRRDLDDGSPKLKKYRWTSNWSLSKFGPKNHILE